MKNAKNILIILAVIAGTLGLLVVLAKVGNKTNTPPTVVTKPVLATEHIRGPVNAPITLVEYSDFQCPACRTYEPTLKRLSSEYDQELRIVYRHFPLRSIHPHAEEAAWASEAASAQGKFWEFHDVLFNTQDKWTTVSDPESMFVEYAKSLGLNEEQFKNDYKSNAVKERVNSDAKTGEDAHISGTPSFFLNGKFLEAPQTYEGFSAAVVEQIILTGNNNVGNLGTSTTP